MAKFITRIELHKADSDDYDTLHTEMKNEGFTKTITDSNNVAYYLPDGEYHYDKSIPVDPNKNDYEIVLDKGKRAAQKTKKAFSIITSRKDISTWAYLDKVD